MPVITTATTSGVILATSENLAVTASGSIFAPTQVIDGSNGTNQSVTIAGYVETFYLWLGGANQVNITQSGVYAGHSGATSLFVGLDAIGTPTGGSVINNAGLITADNNGIKMFGGSNLLFNTGTIVAEGFGVSFETGNADQFINQGSISTRIAICTNFSGNNHSLTNTGLISARDSMAMLAVGNNFQLVNSGHIVSANTIGVAAAGVNGNGCIIRNDGWIDSATGPGLQYVGSENDLTNSGVIHGKTHGVLANDFTGSITNTGEISAANGYAIALDAGEVPGGTYIINSGVISARNTAIITGEGTEVIYNNGTINGAINMGGGADVFDGRGGTVTGNVSGGNGADIYYIDNSSIVITEFPADNAIDAVFSEASYKLVDNVEFLFLLGAEDLNGAGNTGDNSITGNAGNNRLSGLTGNDTIAATGGDDRLLGGGGNDSLSGGDGDDLLRGGDGNDTLIAGDGDDLLISGTGRDTLTGSAGSDTFIFAALSHSGKSTANADAITDFTRGEDRIDLSAIDAKSTNGNPNDTFTFIGAAAFGNVAGQLNFTIDVANNATFIRLDVDGDGTADSTIRLTGQIALTAGDFLL